MQPDIICLSHLRWDFVYQRPQHLMSRLAKDHRIFFIEEPQFDAVDQSYYHIYIDAPSNVHVIVSHLPPGLDNEEIIKHQRIILDSILRFQTIGEYLLWYYTPMAWPFTDHLSPVCRVYDCMDELSAFLFAPAAMKTNEAALLKAADLVFTGGNSLYEAKKSLHPNIHPFPSSIDKQHFMNARKLVSDPEDQRKIPRPRIGFYGVIDERLDISLLGTVADSRPDWHFILVGPVVKIDPGLLPIRQNIHYLGPKSYSILPQYLCGWDIAMMPFAMNASTRFISPTKTPEYLAGGKPVISPSIADVVEPYGRLGLVHIADTAGQFIEAAEKIFREGKSSGWLTTVDEFLSGQSWDETVAKMWALIAKAISEKKNIPGKKTKFYV